MRYFIPHYVSDVEIGLSSASVSPLYEEDVPKQVPTTWQVLDQFRGIDVIYIDVTEGSHESDKYQLQIEKCINDQCEATDYTCATIKAETRFKKKTSDVARFSSCMNITKLFYKRHSKHMLPPLSMYEYATIKTETRYKQDTTHNSTHV